MKTTVEFLFSAGEDMAGDVKAIDAKRAQRLVRTGYVRLIDGPETAMIEAPEAAMRPRAQSRGKAERRG